MRGRWLPFAACFAVACDSVPTWDGYEKQLAAYHGRDANELVMALGEPTRRTDIEHGHKIYVWEQMSQAHTEKKIVERYNGETQQREYVVEGGERIPFDCTTTAFVDAAGLITKTTAEGVACLGIAPAAPASVVAPPAPVADPTPSHEPVPETVGTDTDVGTAAATRSEQRRARRRER